VQTCTFLHHDRISFRTHKVSCFFTNIVFPCKTCASGTWLGLQKSPGRKQVCLACWWKFRAASCYSAQVATSGFLATVSCGTWLLGHMASGSDSSSDSSSDTDSAWICNEGESTDNDEETPADQSLRGEAALVHASTHAFLPTAASRG